MDDIFEFVPTCREKLKKFMEEKISEKEPNPSKWNQYTCHQLCDWDYLTDENGNVLIGLDNCVTLVKYAVILRDELWN